MNRRTALRAGALPLLLFAAVHLVSREAMADMWIKPSELAGLPASGPAWDALKQAADNIGPALGGHTSDHDVNTLAAALVAVRLADPVYKQLAADNLIAAIGSESNCFAGMSCNALSIARNMASYCIAAELIDLPAFDPVREPSFRAWVLQMRDVGPPAAQGGCSGTGTCSLIGKQEDRPNNQGTMAGASRIACSLYLGDVADVDRAAQVFAGWQGDRSEYSEQSVPGFDYGSDLSWQCDETQPVGVNPLACVKFGNDLGGAQPEEMRRGCSYLDGDDPPFCQDVHNWEGLQGAIVAMHLLVRQGYSGHPGIGDAAVLRAAQWLSGPSYGDPAAGDDLFQLPLFDALYGTTEWQDRGFPTVGSGKIMGWTDWTHDCALNPGCAGLTAVPALSTPGRLLLLGSIAAALGLGLAGWRTRRRTGS